MRALLIQHGCEVALEVLPEEMKAQAKTGLNKKAHSAMILCLGNKVLREVTVETTVAGVWSKLKTLYMTKSLANKLYLKKKVYTFCMPAGQKISKHIDEFNKIVLDLANIEDVMATINSKEIKERSKAKRDDGEGYIPELKRNLISLGTLEKEGYTVKLQSGKVKVINGSRFEQLCIESGIARHLTVVETPQQNRVAERMNRTLMDKVHSIEKKTPMEMWSGHPSDYEMLRIFGCVAYLHDKQGKLEPRAIKCILLGYPEGVKGYRLYNHTLEEDQIDQEDGDDEDAGDHETDQTPDLTDYQLARDRERMTRMKPVACEDSSKWKAAMEEEMDSLRKNKTWELVDHPARQKLVCCKWLFKIKEGIKGVQKPRYKARLVARGFTQRADVIYMKQPPGYEQGNKVCLLKKSLYGLKQSPRQWYRRFDEYLLSNGFKHSSYDSCVYYRSYAPGEYIYLLLYVDDMLIACKSKAEIGSTKYLLKKKFDMKELE
ncbi:retrotransposon protein, putative, ty1-copia subclass [Tanacetum coccineum]